MAYIEVKAGKNRELTIKVPEPRVNIEARARCEAGGHKPMVLMSLSADMKVVEYHEGVRVCKDCGAHYQNA